MSAERYVPAAGRAFLTGLYDPIVALTMREPSWRPALLAELSARLPAGGTAIDVGAGTGTFALALAAARPDASVVAVDGDPESLERAQAKPGAATVDWRTGLAGELPIATGAADAVSMSLLLHHLAPAGKQAALADARRVLRDGGSLHVADWGRPRGALPSVGFLALRCLDGFEPTRDHAAGRLGELVAAAGFREPRTWRRLATPWGTLELLAAGA